MLNYLLYRIGQFIAVSIPLGLAYKVAIVFSDLHYLFAFRDKKQVRDNLKTIFPDKNLAEINKIQIDLFRNFAKYLVDFFRFEKINQSYIRKHIKIEGKHHLDDAVARNKGTIILTAHLGNWELGGVVLAQEGYQFWVVALPHKDKRVNEFFNYQRQVKGVKVIPLGRAARTIFDILEMNKIIGLVGDRDFTQKGIVVDFFGKPTIFPQGPAAFAVKTKAPIIPGFMLRNKDDSFTLKIEKPIEVNSNISSEEEIKKVIDEYRKTFESYIRKYPEQWYMFKRFWKT